MKYQSKQDLPATIRTTLPVEAQAIYLAAYNATWDRYNPDKEPGDMGREAAAHRDGWNAVLHEYEYNAQTGVMYRKGEEPEAEIVAKAGVLDKMRAWFRHN